MTKRKLIFRSPIAKCLWIVSEPFVGDKAELAAGGPATCAYTWAEFLEAASTVDNMTAFMNALSFVWRSYDPAPGPLGCPRLSFAHSPQELRALTDGMDEVWEVAPPTPGAHLLEAFQ